MSDENKLTVKINNPHEGISSTDKAIIRKRNIFAEYPSPTKQIDSDIEPKKENDSYLNECQAQISSQQMPKSLPKNSIKDKLPAPEFFKIKIKEDDARHTYASLFMMNGGNLYDLKKILGHASVSTTEKYSHLSPNHLAGLKDVLKLNLTSGADVISLQNLKHSPSNPLRDFSDVENVV